MTDFRPFHKLLVPTDARGVAVFAGGGAMTQYLPITHALVGVDANGIASFVGGGPVVAYKPLLKVLALCDDNGVLSSLEGICPGGLSTVLSATQTQQLPGWDGNPTPLTDVVVAKAHVASIQSVTQDPCSGYQIVLTFDDINGAVLAAMQAGGWVFWNQITSLQPGTFNIGDTPLGIGNNSFSVCGTGGLWTGTQGGQSCPAVISWVQWAQTDGNGHTQLFCILQPCDNGSFATTFANSLVGKEVCICTMQGVGGGNPADQPPSLTFSVAEAFGSSMPSVIAGAVIWSDGGNGGISSFDYTGQWTGQDYGWLRATWVYDDGPDTANAVDFAKPPFGSSGDVATVTLTATGNRTPTALTVQWISSVNPGAPPTYGGSVNVQFVCSNG